MNKVAEILYNFPDATEVTLESCSLSSLDEVMPDLIKLKNLKVLRLGNNELSSLPADMSGLHKVEFLDLTNNNFSDLHHIMSGLFSLPSLKHLYINLAEQDEDQIIISLTNLESFNGTPLTDIPDTDFSITEKHKEHKKKALNASVASHSDEKRFQVKESDLENARRLHELSQTYLGLASNFAEFAHETVTELHSKIENETDPLKFQTELMGAKRTLYSSSFDDIIERVNKSDKKLAAVLVLAKQCYSGILEDTFGLLHQMNSDYHKKMRQMQKDLDHAAFIICCLISKDSEIGHLLEAAETLEKESAENEAAKRKLAETFEDEKEKLVEEVGWLRAELERSKNLLRQFQLNRQKISTQVNTSPKQLLHQSMKEKFSEPNGKGKLPTQPIKSNKILSLKQTKEIIDEIYTSKAKFDQKCVDNKLPRETMEQHLYTYLNQKYGLKNLILDWASAIIQAIKKFSNEDNDVAVFGKIMRNEIDEEFRFVQKQLRETVAELLRVYLKGKYARKIDNEIQQMLAQRMTGSLNEDEWVDIIKYMYNKEDSVNVIIKVNEAIRQIRAKKGRRGSNSTGNRGEDDDDDDEKGANRIPYNEFLRVLLNFQLKGHERFLSKFVKLFRQFDSDRNGILNELEFRHLLFTINPHRTEEDIDYWLNYIDPYNNQQITFSECVTFLSADLVKMMSDKKGDFDDDSQISAEDQQASTMYRLHHSVPPQVQYGTPGSNVDEDEDENIDE